MEWIIPNNVAIYKSYLTTSETEILWNNISTTCPLSYINIMIYGKMCKQSRMTAYYGTKDFHYSGQTMPAAPMPSYLENQLQQLNTLFNTTLNSCLINYYPNGDSSIGHHSDGQGYRMGSCNSVVTISLGGSRTFQLKNKKGCSMLPTDIQNITLDNGDLVLMFSETQQQTTHSIIKEKNASPRISLTFRDLL